MKRWQVLAVYVVLGPPLGGLVFWLELAVGATLESAPPTVGAAFESLVPSMNWLLALLYIMLASFVFGLPAAFAAGLTHALLFRRVSPAILIGLVCLAGLGAQLVPALLPTPDGTGWPWMDVVVTAALPPLVSAAILSTSLARRAGPRRRAGDGREPGRD
jgi:hypothetical protein